MSFVPSSPADPTAPVPVSQLPEGALREAFNAAFSDYLVGPPNLRAQDWPLFLNRHGVAPELSRAIVQDERILAFALVGRMDAGGGRERIATMGATPSARGTGMAPRLLDEVLGEARARGARSVELEVFVRNPRAVALYRSRGFEAVAELHGWQRPAGEAPSPGEPAQAVALDEALDALELIAFDGLPFQMGAASVRAALPPLQAWRSGDALLVASLRDATQIGVLSLVDRSPAQDDARRLARTLAARHPGAVLKVPQLLRDDLGGRALEAEGWQRHPLQQLLMRVAL